MLTSPRFSFLLAPLPLQRASKFPTLPLPIPRFSQPLNRFSLRRLWLAGLFHPAGTPRIPPTEFACQTILNCHPVILLLHRYLPSTTSILQQPVFPTHCHWGFPFQRLDSCKLLASYLKKAGFRLRLGPILKLSSRLAGYPGIWQFHPTHVDTTLLAFPSSRFYFNTLVSLPLLRFLPL